MYYVNFRSSNIVLNELSYSLSVFKNLQTLIVNNACFLKIERLGNLRNTVRKIRARSCGLQNLKTLFLCDFTHKDLNEIDHSSKWIELHHLDVSANDLEDIDESVCLAPNLQTLTLKSNRLKHLGENLIKLPNLINLNLCNNQFSVLENLHTKLGNIKSLNLSQNNLTSLQGFSRLYSVVTLNVSSNCLANVSDIEYINQLPCLEELVLTGNPVSTIVDYRTKILELFGKKAWELCLDNEKSTCKELDKVAVLQALRAAREGRMPSFPITQPISPTLFSERTDVGAIARET